MSLLAPLLAASFLAPVAPPFHPPALAMFAGPDKVILTIYSNRTGPMEVVDPRDADGAYSGTFIRVTGPDGEPVSKERDGWWSPPRSTEGSASWLVPPAEAVNIHMAPSSLTRGLDGPTTGLCHFQARAVIRDRYKPYGAETDIYTVESGWAEVPCADLFPAR